LGDLEGFSSEQMYDIEMKEEKNQYYDPGLNIEKRALFSQRIFDGIYQAQIIHPHPLIISHGRVFLQLCQIMDIDTNRQISNCLLCKFYFEKNRWKFETKVF
jgi:hypothetical protein